MVYRLFFVLEHIPGLGDGVSPLSIGSQLAFTVAWSLKGLDSNLKNEKSKYVTDTGVSLYYIESDSILIWIFLTSG